ncbi:hypothetical protein CPT_Maestro_023 [Acinetobacter phage Maestro]|nr:hypothetical protein CPT_Maestro_023 [Acinetobacter phage Maestro]
MAPFIFSQNTSNKTNFGAKRRLRSSYTSPTK